MYPGGRVSLFHNKKFKKNTFVQEKEITDTLGALADDSAGMWLTN